MPTTGRRTWGLVTMLRCSLNLSGGLAAKSDGAIPFTCGLPSGVAGNDVGAHPLRRLADDLVDDRPEVSGPVVHGKLAVGAGAASHDLEGVLHFAPTAELVHDVVDEPLQHLRNQFASRQLLRLAEVDELAIQSEAHGPPLILVHQGRRVQSEGEV